MSGLSRVDDAVRAALSAPCGAAAGRIVIGYSGGLDSSVLLHAAARHHDARGRLLALHVNHGLSPNADAWQRHCETVCGNLAVECTARRVAVAPRGNVEAAARSARYEAFGEVLGDGDVLWLGHHQDDQAETVLLRLLRGGGAGAMAAIPATRTIGRGTLQRPLLDVPRADLVQWASANRVKWVDDESNSDVGFERNFIRHQVLPVLRRRWLDADALLHAAAGRFGDEARLLTGALDAQLDAAETAARALPMTLLDEPHARLLLRRWLERTGIFGTRDRVLVEIVRQCHCAADRAPAINVGAGFTVRRHARHLHAIACVAQSFEPTQWRLAEELRLPMGRLVACRGQGSGLRATLAAVEVRPRRGGERLRPAGRGGSRSVKRLLQEADVPQWLRTAYPLVFVDDQLAAVPGIAVEEAFADVSAAAWRLVLRPSAHVDDH